MFYPMFCFVFYLNIQKFIKVLIKIIDAIKTLTSIKNLILIAYFFIQGVLYACNDEMIAMNTFLVGIVPH